MLELQEEVKINRAASGIENLFQDLFNEWQGDLNTREKEIWLWNSLVQMAKIKQRRELS